MDKKDMAQDKKMAKKAVGMHESQLHGGKKSDLAKLKKVARLKKCLKAVVTHVVVASKYVVKQKERCANHGRK